MALYNDRVFAFDRMKALSPVLPLANSEQLQQYCSDDDRNYLAFQELAYFEKHNNFLHLHPLLQTHQQEHELEILRRSNPAEFSNQLVNAQKSIERYNSRLSKKKYRDDKERHAWSQLVLDYEKKLKIMQILISK
jgi:hypothetical protein